jgi:hypothetical protein
MICRQRVLSAMSNTFMSSVSMRKSTHLFDSCPFMLLRITSSLSVCNCEQMPVVQSMGHFFSLSLIYMIFLFFINIQRRTPHSFYQKYCFEKLEKPTTCFILLYFFFFPTLLLAYAQLFWCQCVGNTVITSVSKTELDSCVILICLASH